MTEENIIDPQTDLSAQPAAPLDTTLGGNKSSITVVWGLMLANVLVPFLGLAALILAYVRRADASDSPAALSHYNKAITLFWLSLAGYILGAMLWLFIIGIPIVIAVGIWVLVVAIKGLTRALDGREYG